MNKIKLFAFFLLALCFGSCAAFAEDEDRQARAARWENYALPTSEFTRFLDKKRGFSLWRPAEWKEKDDPSSLSFSAKPGEQTVLLITEPLPEGYGVASYTTAILQNLRKGTVNLDSVVVRHVLIGGVEGREISYEIEGAAGTVRQIYWVTQVGPIGFNMVLTCSLEDQEKLEPYFKRMMMSVRFTSAGHWGEDFESLRAKLATGTTSDKDADAAKLSEAIRTAKEPTAAIRQRLTVLANKAPEVVSEMLTDYDPNVRAAAIEALGKSSDARFNELLVWALTDKDAFCSNRAAQALSERGVAGLAAIKNDLPKLVEAGSSLLRVAALVSDEAARELAEELLKSDASSHQLVGMRLAVAFPLRGLRLPYIKLFATSNVHVIGHTMEAIRLRRPTEDVPDLLKMMGTDAELWAVHALGELATPAIETPLSERKKLLSARYDKLLTAKGVVTVRATDSSSLSPPPPPPAPVGTKRKAGTGAIRGVPGGVPVTAPVMAGYLNNSSPASTPPVLFKAESEITKLWSLVTELEDALTKIKLRDRWANAKDEAARHATLDEANKNERLKQWAKVTLKTPSITPAVSFDLTKLKNAPTTGETLFPSNATLYLTAPNFEQTINQLDAAFSGIQMSTVRDQMTFALMLNGIKAQLANKMNLSVTGSASQTLGFDLQAPISIAAWPAESNAENNQASFSAIANSAVVVRVTDQARFERTLTMYQNDFGGFGYFVPGVSLGARFASLTPALMPVIFYAVSAVSDLASTVTSTGKSRAASQPFTLGSAVYARHEKIGELPVTVFEKLGYVGIDSTDQERIYLAYLGDTAVLAPSRAALLAVLNTDKPTITSNQSFARIKAEKGELVFFSQLDTLFKNFLGEVSKEIIATKEKDPFDTVITEAMTKALGAETGAMRLSPGDWDAVFHLGTNDNDLIKTLRPFKASDLSAPRDLLPKHTLLYAATMIDPEKFIAYSQKWDAEIAKANKAAGKEEKKETKKEVEKISRIYAGLQSLLVPHLQGEVSLALVNVSNALNGKAKLPAMVAALKLKNDTLAKMARSGLVSLALKRVPDASALNSPVFKLGDDEDDFFVTITDNYFVLADSLATLKMLEDKEKFATARDFSNPAKLAPERLALFSTLSIDAVFADLRTMFEKNAPAKDAESNEFLERMSAWAHAFHSYRMLLALTNDNTLEGQLGISFDREGRYSVGAMNRTEFDLENALIAPNGVHILKPTRVEALKLKVSARQPGVIARVREDVSKFTWHTIEPNATDASLVFTSHQRRIPDKLTIKLPVASAEFAPYLKATARINANSPEIVKLAKEIAGKERDGRVVAEKLGQWTYENLKWKRVSSTSVETLAAREADCFEHSELYVALARALGLPARVVSGAAYGDGSFGAHAWVEIYLGKWVEIDPTWGLKDYVDATHLRFDGDGFISYAQLNQVNFEVLETRSMVADYQRDPVRLVKEFASKKAADTRVLAFDLELTAEQVLGAGAFAKLDEKQRAMVINAFDRVIAAVADDWELSGTDHPNILVSESKNNRATLLVLFGQRLARFSLAARDGVWYVTEIEDADDGELSFGDPLQAIFDPATSVAPIRAATNLDRAMQRLEQVITSKGESAPLLLLKSNILRTKQNNERAENLKQSVDANKTPTEKAEKPAGNKLGEPQPTRPDEAQLLLEKITARWPNYAPAHYALANSFDETAQEKAIAAYQRYAKLMPLDPRPWEQLAFLYDELKRLDEAEAAYREIIARDRENIGRQANLIGFHLRHSQLDKAKARFTETLKQHADANLLLESLDRLVMHDPDDETSPEMAQQFEELLLSFPKELAASVNGLRSLSEAQRTQKKYDAAIKTLQKVITLNPDAGDEVTITGIYRESKRYAQALVSADQAIKKDGESASAHYERACALAQLGRKREALATLKKVIELDDAYAYDLAAEADLQPLAALPAFKALLPKEEAPAEPDTKPEQSKAAKQ